MLIIFEGPDGSGKTTLINQLIERHTLDSKVTIPRGAAYQRNIYDSLTNCHATFGADRSCISDIVYRTVDNQQRDELNLSTIGQILSAPNIRIVYCDTPKSFDYAQARGEKLITDPKVHKRICQVYNDFMFVLSEYTNVQILKYDFKKDKIENVIEFINDGKF